MTNKAELAKAIEGLRAEINALEGSDEKTRTHLAQLAALMEAQLQNSGMEAQDASTVDTIKDLIEAYETKYPRITAMANDLMIRLAAMGI